MAKCLVCEQQTTGDDDDGHRETARKDEDLYWLRLHVDLMHTKGHVEDESFDKNETNHHASGAQPIGGSCPTLARRKNIRRERPLPRQ